MWSLGVMTFLLRANLALRFHAIEWFSTWIWPGEPSKRPWVLSLWLAQKRMLTILLNPIAYVTTSWLCVGARAPSSRPMHLDCPLMTVSIQGWSSRNRQVLLRTLSRCPSVHVPLDFVCSPAMAVKFTFMTIVHLYAQISDPYELPAACLLAFVNQSISKDRHITTWPQCLNPLSTGSTCSPPYFVERMQHRDAYDFRKYRRNLNTLATKQHQPPLHWKYDWVLMNEGLYLWVENGSWPSSPHWLSRKRNKVHVKPPRPS